jgi:hypothetical protein
MKQVHNHDYPSLLAREYFPEEREQLIAKSEILIEKYVDLYPFVTDIYLLQIIEQQGLSNTPKNIKLAKDRMTYEMKEFLAEILFKVEVLRRSAGSYHRDNACRDLEESLNILESRVSYYNNLYSAYQVDINPNAIRIM